MEYRKIKDKHRVTGTGRKKWKFLESLDQVLGNKPTTVVPVVVDTLQETTETEDVAEENLNKPLSDNQLSMNQSVSLDSSQVDNTHKKTSKEKNREVWV